MTEHDHLDDDALSSVLDGDGDGGAAAALASCPICATRLEALRGASRAMAAAQVPPLPAGVVDDLVARALAAPAEEPAVGPPAGAGAGAGDGGGRGGRSPVRGRSRWHAPPPAWLLAAAAAIVVLVATAGLVRSGRGGDDRALSARTDAVDASGAASGSADGSGSLAANATATAGAPPPADAVISDLGTVDDEDALVAALGPSLAAAQATAAAPAPAAGSSELTSGGATAGVAAPDAPTAGSGTADRAQCRAQAERFGAGRLGPLASTHTVRWRGEPAEVLVFALAEPRDGLSREAVVLGRPGCSILADRRF